jgi:tetratricopeptide (TPR) repeat protein
LGTMVPVIGIVQVGLQSSADRYAYVPLIGLFIAVTWALGDVAEWFPRARAILVVVCGVALMACAMKTREQISYWKNSTTLFRHAVAVTRNNYAAHHDLGLALESDGDLEGALQQFRMALEINPNSLKSATNLEIGKIKEKQGKLAEAEQYFKEALGWPNNRRSLALAHIHLANLLAKKSDFLAAEAEYRDAIRLNPAEAYSPRLNLAVLLVKQGRYDAAIQQYSELIKETPVEASLYFLLGGAREKQAQVAEAADAYRKALEVDPGYAPALSGLNRLVAHSH